MGDTLGWLKSVHIWRKVPADLTEATVAGGTISLLSTVVMAYLFFVNFSAYLSVTQATSIVLDSSDEKKLQLNFNVTLHHLPCRFASLDIVDVMGTHLQNVSANILKTRIDASGAIVGHAPSVQREIAHSSALVAAGPDAPKFAPDLDQRTFLEQVRPRCARAPPLLLARLFLPVPALTPPPARAPVRR